MRQTVIGRATASTNLAAWAAADSTEPARLVTGEPGSGASWLAGWAVLAADSGARSFVDAPGDVPLPPPGAFDVVVDAAGKSSDQVADEIAEQVAQAAGTPPGAFGALALARAAKKLQRPLVVAVLNAADSGSSRLSGASRPVIRKVLMQLLRAGELSAAGVPLSFTPVRVLADLPRDEAALLARKAGLDRTCVLDLDAPELVPSRDEFTRWVYDVLTVRGGHYAADAGQAATAKDIAALVAGRAWPNFRLAEAVACILRARPQPWDATKDRPLPEAPTELWDFLLAGAGEAADRLAVLLAPVVVAEGAYGIPESLWREAAARLLGEPVTVRQLRAAAALVPAFLEQTPWSGADGSDDVAEACWRVRETGLARLAPSYADESVHQVLAEVSEETLPLGDVVAVTGAAGPPGVAYARRYGVVHALRGSAFDHWLSDPARASVTDPDTLMESLRAAGPADGAGALRRRTALWEERRAYHEYPARDVAERVSRLQWCATLCGDDELASWADTSGLALPWRTLWSSMRPLGAVDTSLTDPQWPGPLGLVAVRPEPDDTHLCVEDMAEGSYQWWSVAEGRSIGDRFGEEPPEAEDQPEPDGRAQDGATELWFDEDAPTPQEPLMLRAPDPLTGQTTVSMVSATQGYADVAPLGSGRFCVVGHSGLAVVEAGGDAGRRWPRLPVQRVTGAVSPWLFDGAWTRGDVLLTAEPLRQLWRRGSGAVTAGPDAAGLEALSEVPDAARILREIGLPRRSPWCRDTEEALRTLTTYRSWLAQRGIDDLSGDAHVVIARPARGGADAALCLDSRTGEVGSLTPERRTLVNSSLAQFLRFQAITDWAAAFGTSRDRSEHGEFRSWLHRLLSTLDPAAFEERQGGTFWPQVFHDDMAFLLE
ncbi:hypothetical protein [Streptomyces sp. NPDC059639]|uniref:hypothetical protein n=1 Tax=Streptomyces sp. NPDC059639 TaxID=3346891 RepID=UPI0036CA2080